MKRIEYSIVNGPSWSDLKEATFHSLHSPHLPKITFTIRPYEENLSRKRINLKKKSTRSGINLKKEKLEVISETINAEIKVASRMRDSGTDFLIEIAVLYTETLATHFFKGFYCTDTREGYLKPGSYILL